MLGVLLVGLLALLAAAALVDANYLRAPLTRFVSARTGRSIRIDGSLKAHLLSFTPRVVAERVAIGNPPWMPPGPTAEVGRLSLSFKLLPLLSRSFIISDLEMDAAALHLARAADGRANWQAHAPGTADTTGPPLTYRLLVRNARVYFDDAARHLKFDGTVSVQDAAQAAGGMKRLRIDGAGELNGRNVTFAIDADPLASVKRDTPYRFAFVERSSGSQLKGSGVLPHPFDVRMLETSFEASGEDLKDLYFLVGVTLPDTGPYRLSGKLARSGLHFRYTDLRATSGESDMRGTLLIDSTSERPIVEAELSSEQLRVSDLGERAAGRVPASKAAQPLLLPEKALPLFGIRHDDATVNFHAKAVIAGRTALHAVAARLAIDHGILTVAPFSATLGDGKVSGHLRFAAASEVPAAELELKFTDLHLADFVRKGPSDPPLEGSLQARLSLRGHGDSIHQLASAANGTVTAVLPHGAIRASFAELMGIDVTRVLGLKLRKDTHDTSIRCGIVNFLLKDGHATAQTFVIDTDPVLITGKGDIRLDSEALDLAVNGHPKTFRLVRLRSPVLIRGTLKHPSIGIEARNSMAQAGEAIALGALLTPIAAVLAFVDPGLAKDADCAALLAEAKAQGVHVNPAAAAR